MHTSSESFKTCISNKHASYLPNDAALKFSSRQGLKNTKCLHQLAPPVPYHASLLEMLATRSKQSEAMKPSKKGYKLFSSPHLLINSA
jgi:hypothetical protein